MCLFSRRWHLLQFPALTRDRISSGVAVGGWDPPLRLKCTTSLKSRRVIIRHQMRRNSSSELNSTVVAVSVIIVVMTASFVPFDVLSHTTTFVPGEMILDETGNSPSILEGSRNGPADTTGLGRALRTDHNRSSAESNYDRCACRIRGKDQNCVSESAYGILR